jgi:hypothetical protein
MVGLNDVGRTTYRKTNATAVDLGNRINLSKKSDLLRFERCA